MLKLSWIALVFLTSLPVNSSELAHSASPYVAMHKGDPIPWREWGPAVLREAKQKNQLIFLTIGYFSCYWCHVLQRESFQDRQVVTTLNAHFVSVVVDREVHSALDASMVAFAEKTIGRSGWPLNIILTPDGYPLLAAIYLPPKRFDAWLNKALGLWETDPQYIRGIAKDAAQELQMLIKPRHRPLSAVLADQVAKRFVREVKANRDELNGGFGEQSKFPLPAILQAILQLYERNKDAELAEFLDLTLEQMRTRGLRDQLDDGFFRYTSDPAWELPHFEKMLYDNAQLAQLYLQAGKAFGREEWIATGEAVLAFLERRFKAPGGGYYSSTSAVDEQGVEGGYYLWSKARWQALLGPREQQVVQRLWGWDGPPLLEEGYYPLYQAQPANDAEKRLLASAIEKLRRVRDERHLPMDKKVVFAWNALLLDAFVTAHEVTQKPVYQARSQALAKHLISAFERPGPPRAVMGQTFIGHAVLEDYAYVSHALLRYHRRFNVPKAWQLTQTLLANAWSRFFNDAGWLLDDKTLLPAVSRENMLADGPLPSASAYLIQASLQTGRRELVARARSALELGHGRLQSQAFWYASHILLLQNHRVTMDKRQVK